MRLLKLKIKNIASLKGEHVINFADIQNQSPLFAITGETGSGKSTILNCLGLALYGQIFKKNVNQIDVVTLGEKEGLIELIFQVKGKNYLAFWKARVRKQNGELYSTVQSPTRDLYLLEGDHFDSPKNISSLKVDEILNLDFDQFCKCIILNQGEFAKFLMSTFTERKDILEKLYSGEMLESLSRELKLELDAYQKQKNDLDIELGTLKGDGLRGEDLVVDKARLKAELDFHDTWENRVLSMNSNFETLFSYHAKFESNQKKMELIKQEMNQQTKIRNESLLKTQNAQDLLQEATRIQEKERPRLEELLKSEEALLGHRDVMSAMEKKLLTLAEQIQNQQKSGDALKIRENQVDLSKRAVVQKLTLPLEELKAHRRGLDELFDLFQDQNSLDEVLKSKNLRLSELESSGKEKATDLKVLQEKIAKFPTEAKTELASLLVKKNELLPQIENKQRAEIKAQELKLSLEALKIDLQKIEEKIKSLGLDRTKFESEALPIETTLSLSELMSAVAICRTHPSVSSSETCPVCETPLSSTKWEELKKKISQTDLIKQKERFAELSRLLMQNQEEIKLAESQVKSLKDSLNKKETDLKNLAPFLGLVISSMSDLDKIISQKEKEIWEVESLKTDELKLEVELARAREGFGVIRQEVTLKTQELKNMTIEISKLSAPMKKLIPDTLSKELIQKLKTELKLMLDIEALDNELSKVAHEKELLTREEQKVKAEQTQLLSDQKDLEAKIQKLYTHLVQELAGKKASALLSEMAQSLKALNEDWLIKNQDLKKQDLAHTEISSRLRSAEELLRDFELGFIKAKDELKLAAEIKLPSLKESLSLLTSTLNSLTLDLKSPSELFVPLKELLLTEKEFLKELTLNTRKNLAQVMARLEDWEKRQDKITLLELKNSDLKNQLDRLERLYEVLGKDELRAFVLSLVEENLIAQTNDELQKLCQGRYEIIHGSRRKMSPEFYVLDKYKEGETRKVSTLSGGETFMVSLAMALALAEMTRGQAEIDTLFIDEGFGTLDQDSLEDVLDMLNQIQTRGLMVGIISHIKPLTQALPVNLVLNKAQDGTSSLSIQYN